MAKTNYSYEKRQRELAKKKKQEEKRQKKANRQDGGQDTGQEDGANPPDSGTTSTEPKTE